MKLPAWLLDRLERAWSRHPSCDFTMDRSCTNEVRCAHCRKTEAEHYALINSFQMHHHLWQPSEKAWRSEPHDCPICLHEYPECCVPPSIGPRRGEAGHVSR